MSKFFQIKKIYAKIYFLKELTSKIEKYFGWVLQMIIFYM